MIKVSELTIAKEPLTNGGVEKQLLTQSFCRVKETAKQTKL